MFGRHEYPAPTDTLGPYVRGEALKACPPIIKDYVLSVCLSVCPSGCSIGSSVAGFFFQSIDCSSDCHLIPYSENRGPTMKTPPRDDKYDDADDRMRDDEDDDDDF